MVSGAPTLSEWLDQFVSAVRANDLDAGMSLFEPDVVGYGVIANRMTGLDDLRARQWSPTWRRVSEWRVLHLDVQVESDPYAVVAFTWERVNNDDDRTVRGRATLALRRGQDGGWRCLHSHFSAGPGPTEE